MNLRIAEYIRSKEIDSYQKLHLLLFFYRYPDLEFTIEALANRLYFGDRSYLLSLINGLCRSGLVEALGNSYRLRKTPAVWQCLTDFVKAFSNPLTRQEIIERVGYYSNPFIDYEAAHEPQWNYQRAL